jgi:two-component system response regulator AtoC
VIRQALEQEKWNRTRAALVLGISRCQLFDKVRQYGLQK